MVQFQSFARFPVDYLSHSFELNLVLLLSELTEFTYNVINSFILFLHITSPCNSAVSLFKCSFLSHAHIFFFAILIVFCRIYPSTFFLLFLFPLLLFFPPLIIILLWYYWLLSLIFPGFYNVVLESIWCPWCNVYHRRKWTRQHEFKSWTRLIEFHRALIPLGKVWIQLFSLQLWANSRADWVLQPWWGN